MDWCHSARDAPDDAAKYDYAALAKASRPDGVRVKTEKLRRQLTREGRLVNGRIKPGKRVGKTTRSARTADDDETEIETPAARVDWVEERAVLHLSAPAKKSTEGMSDAELAQYGKELLAARHAPRRRPESAPPMPTRSRSEQMFEDVFEETKQDESAVPEPEVVHPPPKPAKKPVAEAGEAPLLAVEPEPAPAWRAAGRGKGRSSRGTAAKKTVRYSSVDAARKANKTNDDQSYGASIITSVVKSANAAFYG